MKFFIFTCFIAHLLTGISTRVRRTTPMKPAFASNNDEARQVSKYADMIDFVNTVYTENDDGRSFIRRHGPSKHQISRRFKDPLDAMNLFSKVHQVRDKDTKTKLSKLTDTVRYHVIDNPEILYDYRTKLKNKIKQGTLDSVKASSDAKSFRTAEYKSNNFHSQMEAGAVSHDNTVITADPKVISPNDPVVQIKARDDVKDITTDKAHYRPSFADEDDDDKTITDGIDLKINEKENNKPKTDKKDHGGGTEITISEEDEKRILNNKGSGEVDIAQIDTEKINSNDLKENSQMTTENRVTKFISSQEELNEDSRRPKDKDEKKNDSNTDENSEKEKTRSFFAGFLSSSDKHDKKLTSVEKLISKRDNQISNDRIEQHSIYSLIERSVNRNKHFKESHEKKNKYVKEKDRNLDRRDDKESQSIKINNQRDHNKNHGDNLDERWSKKEKKWNKNPDKWSKKEKEFDQNHDRLGKKNKFNDNNDGSWRKKQKNWDKNDDRSSQKEKNPDNYGDRFSKKDKDWNKHNDRWSKKEKDSNKKGKQRDHEDKRFDTMEYEWNKRHQENDRNENDAQYDNIGHEWDQKDKDWKERDNEYKKRDSNWFKRDDERYKRHGRTEIYDRNVSENKYSGEHIDKKKDVRHDRYKIVERNSRDSSKGDDSGFAFG